MEEVQKSAVKPDPDQLYQEWGGYDSELVYDAFMAGWNALKKVLGNEHFVTFSPDSMTVEHSVDCRLEGNLATCEYGRSVNSMYDLEAEMLNGRWRILDVKDGVPSLERADK